MAIAFAGLLALFGLRWVANISQYNGLFTDVAAGEEAIFADIGFAGLFGVLAWLSGGFAGPARLDRALLMRDNMDEFLSEIAPQAGVTNVESAIGNANLEPDYLLQDLIGDVNAYRTWADGKGYTDGIAGRDAFQDPLGDINDWIVANVA